MSRPLRVLQLMKTLRRGGAEVLAASLPAFHSSDVEITIAAFDRADDGLSSEIERAGARVRFIDAPTHLGLLTAVDRIARAIRTGRFDLVHCHLPLVGVVGRLAAQCARRPVVYTEHNIFRCYHPATRMLALATWHLQRTAIAVSAEVAAAMPPGPEIVVVKNGVDTARFCKDRAAGAEFRRELGIRPDDLLVGAACVFRRAKRLDRFIDVAAIVLAREPRARFVLAGYGPLEEDIKRRLRNAGLGDRVRLLGAQADVRPLLSALDVYLMTSDFEGLPIALLEAMAAEVPVVAPAVGGIGEVVRHGDTGLLSTTEAPVLAEAVLDLLRAPAEERNRFGRRGRDHVVAEHGLAATARAIEGVYANALEAFR
jgi:glycosyltransferase involved in cell wall biosynthesis